jgi:hypothetical protein
MSRVFYSNALFYGDFDYFFENFNNYSLNEIIKKYIFVHGYYQEDIRVIKIFSEKIHNLLPNEQNYILLKKIKKKLNMKSWVNLIDILKSQKIIYNKKIYIINTNKIFNYIKKNNIIIKKFTSISYNLKITLIHYNGYNLYYVKKYFNNVNIPICNKITYDNIFNFIMKDVITFKNYKKPHPIIISEHDNLFYYKFYEFFCYGRISFQHITFDSKKILKLTNYIKRINALMFWEIFKNIEDNSAIEKVFNNEYLKREIISFV